MHLYIWIQSSRLTIESMQTTTGYLYGWIWEPNPLHNSISFKYGTTIDMFLFDQAINVQRILFTHDDIAFLKSNKTFKDTLVVDFCVMNTKNLH